MLTYILLWFFLPTGSGKTTILLELLKFRNKLFQKPPVGVVFCFGIWQEAYEKYQNEFHFNPGLPSTEELVSFHEKFKGEFWLLILDDLMNSVAHSSLISDIYSKGAHHYNLSCINLIQNLYVQGKEARSISLNTHFFILCRTSRDVNQLGLFGLQAYNNKQGFLEIYKDAMEHPFRTSLPPYLLCGCHPRQSCAFSLMSNIIPPGDVKILYRLD